MTDKITYTLQLVPKGYKVVPVEPTEEQLEATPPVLRWEDGDLVIGTVAIATTCETINGVEWAIINFEKWHRVSNIEEARRAAEKALGFLDGLIIEEA